MDRKRQNLVKILWYAGIFLFFYIWFSQVHPLVVYDLDDWTYLAYIRPATPVWGDWNPAKVFPEVVMPFFSTLGRYLLYPLLGDYITALTITHALVVSGFITVYFACFVHLLKRIFPLSDSAAALACILFGVFHFLVFRTEETANRYLFSGVDLNCYYNYVIPGLINASVVMYMLANHPFQNHLRSRTPLRAGVLLLVFYLAVFSNLVDSGMLGAYAGSCLLVSLWTNRKQLRLRPLLKENSVSLGILGLWLVSAVFELSGGRAGSAGDGSFGSSLRVVVKAFLEILGSCNGFFWACVAAITVGALACFFLSGKNQPDASKFLRSFGLCFLAAAAQTLYMLMLCAVVSTGYIRRSECLFPPFFFYFLLVFLGLGYLLSRLPRLAVVLPLVLVILASQLNTYGSTFREGTTANLPGKICAQISRGTLEQILLADQQGAKEMTLYVPMYVSDPETMDNWPYSLVLISRISRTLYEHGLITYPIELHAVPSAQLNELYHLPIPEE